MDVSRRDRFTTASTAVLLLVLSVLTAAATAGAFDGVAAPAAGHLDRVAEAIEAFVFGSMP